LEIGLFRWPLAPQELVERQTQQHRKHEDCGVLRGKGQPRGQAHPGQTCGRRCLHVAVESVGGGEHKAGKPHVGGHHCTVGQQVRIKHQQPERDEPGSGPEHFTGRQKNEQGSQQREHGGGHTRPKQHRVRIVLEQEVLAAQESLMLEKAALEGRDPERHWQQRQGRHQFHQRRMLGI